MKCDCRWHIVYFWHRFAAEICYMAQRYGTFGQIQIRHCQPRKLLVPFSCSPAQKEQITSNLGCLSKLNSYTFFPAPRALAERPLRGIATNRWPWMPYNWIKRDTLWPLLLQEFMDGFWPFLPSQWEVSLLAQSQNQMRCHFGRGVADVEGAWNEK